MTNTLAALLAMGIVGFFVVDFALYESAYILFLGRKFLELVTWLAFWR